MKKVLVVMILVVLVIASVTGCAPKRHVYVSEEPALYPPTPKTETENIIEETVTWENVDIKTFD